MHFLSRSSAGVPAASPALKRGTLLRNVLLAAQLAILVGVGRPQLLQESDAHPEGLG